MWVVLVWSCYACRCLPAIEHMCGWEEGGCAPLTSIGAQPDPSRRAARNLRDVREFRRRRGAERLPLGPRHVVVGGDLAAEQRVAVPE